jgi:hypothetical protein
MIDFSLLMELSAFFLSFLSKGSSKSDRCDKFLNVPTIYLPRDELDVNILATSGGFSFSAVKNLRISLPHSRFCIYRSRITAIAKHLAQ